MLGHSQSVLDWTTGWWPVGKGARDSPSSPVHICPADKLDLLNLSRDTRAGVISSKMVTCQVKQHVCCKLSEERLLVGNLDEALSTLGCSLLVNGSLAPHYGCKTKDLP